MGAYDDLGGTPVESASNAPQDYSELGGVPAGDMPEPNMNPAKKVLTGNLNAAKEQQKDTPQDPGQKAADSFKEDWLAGWGSSIVGLGINHKMPEYVLPEHASLMAKIIAGIPQLAGDSPAMLAGYIGGNVVGGTAGAVAGSPFGGIPGAAVGAVVGSQVGGMAGAFALPAGIRQILMDHYQKGDIKDFQDFYARASSTLWQSIKGAGVGAATSVVGPLAEGLPIASPLLKMGATTAGEAAVMTTVGAAMEGKVPNWGDFGAAAIMLGGFHGLAKGVDYVSKPQVEAKLADVYAKTGLHPNEVTQMAGKDPVLHQELMSKDNKIPESLKSAVDPAAPKDNHIEVKAALDSQTDGMGVKEDQGSLKVEPLADKDDPSIPDEPGEPKKRSAAVNAMLDRIGVQPDAPKESLNFNKFYYNILDKNDPLKNMTKALLGDGAVGSKDDPYGLARSMGSVARKADEIIENGTRDFETLKKTGTPGLAQIWDKVDDLKDYRAYRIAKHAIDLENAGVETGVDVSEAKKTVRELGPKYKDIAKENVKFNNGNIDYLVDSGVLSKDKADIMKDKWQNYSAMNRVMDVGEGSSKGSGGGDLTPYNPIKSIKGSERQIIDPLQSEIVNTHKIVAMAERNRVMTALTDMIDKANAKGDTSWGEPAKTKMVAIDVKGEEISKILQKQGIDPEDAQNLNDVSTIFRAERVPLADDQIASYKDGKRQVYENVPKPIVDAIKNMDRGTLNLFLKMAAGPSQMLRTGMLNSPAFAFRHMFRQEAMNLAMSKDLALPTQHVVSGLLSMFGPEGSAPREALGDWIMHGGGGDSIAAIDNDYLQSKIFDLNEKTGMLDKSWNKVSNYAQFIKHGIELTDEARTLGRYKARLASGETVDPFQAQFQARDTGIDVQRSGATMQAYAALDPFQNIRIQGLDLISRRLKEDPLGVGLKLMGSITVPSVLLWWANHDQDWYKQLSQQDRDTNWHFAVGDPNNGGHIFRVPKPFEPGVVFGALAERLLDAFKDHDPHAFDSFSKTIKDSILPGYVPTFAQPIIEQFANKSFLTDSPLIPRQLENKLPAYQSNVYTSDVSKIVASGLRNIPHFENTPGSLGSPAIVDNYIREWTGGLGQMVISAVDKSLEKSGVADKMGIDYNHTPPESVWSDNPFLRSFVVRYPATNTRAVGQFFDRYNETKTRLDTMQMLLKEGDAKDWEKEQFTASEANQLVNLEGFKKTISEQMGLIKKITADPGTDPHSKRQLIDQLATAINVAADNANKALDQMDYERKQEAKALKASGAKWH